MTTVTSLDVLSRHVMLMLCYWTCLMVRKPWHALSKCFREFLVCCADWATGVAVIVESTYGVSKHLPRDQREQRFVEKVRGILTRGGRVLLPVVALGRAQVHTHPLDASLACVSCLYQKLGLVHVRFTCS